MWLIFAEHEGHIFLDEIECAARSAVDHARLMTKPIAVVVTVCQCSVSASTLRMACLGILAMLHTLRCANAGFGAGI